MKSSIKEDKEVPVLSEELLSDNALLQYRQTADNEVSVVIRYIKSSSIKEVTLFGSSLSGACLGFLLFNLYPAKVMMGDTGSLLLGGAVAAMAEPPHIEVPTPIRTVVLLSILRAFPTK